MGIENYRLDGEARALYYADYRAVYEAVSGILVEGEVIPPDMLVSITGNNILHPTTFDLRNPDRGPVGSFAYPGKSAHVAFTNDIDIACGALFDRKARRGDHLYTIPALQLEELEFYPFYIPLPNLPLHLRLVHSAHLLDPNARDVPYKAKNALAELLKYYQVA